MMETAGEAREHCARGTCRHARGDLGGAIADFGRALEVDPGYPEAWNNRGAARYALGDLAGAVTDLDRALEARPRYAEARNNRGIVRHSLGDLPGALADFDQALAIRPRYAEALGNRATTRRALGDLDGAVADLDRAIGINPGHAAAYLDRAAVLHARGDLDGAAADYDTALGLIPRPAAVRVYHLRAGVRVSQRRFADARADCDRALEIDPACCMAYISRGNARYHLRDPAALEDYLTAFRIDPQAAVAEVFRILTADVREDADAALENCRKHLRICPGDVVARARRGQTLLLLGEEAAAARDLDECLRQAPEMRGPLEHLAERARRHRGG
jgi:tetratricopeptide (TPR) repeat protein